MISGQRRQLFDRQIVIDSDHVPRMDHTTVPETDTAMSPVDRAVFAWTQAVIEYERASLRIARLHRVGIERRRLSGRVTAEDLDPVGLFQRVLDEGEAPPGILGFSKPILRPSDHIFNRRMLVHFQPS